jgi:hypothetical protein
MHFLLQGTYHPVTLPSDMCMMHPTLGDHVYSSTCHCCEISLPDPMSLCRKITPVLWCVVVAVDVLGFLAPQCIVLLSEGVDGSRSPTIVPRDFAGKVFLASREELKWLTWPRKAKQDKAIKADKETKQAQRPRVLTCIQGYSGEYPKILLKTLVYTVHTCMCIGKRKKIKSKQISCKKCSPN